MGLGIHENTNCNSILKYIFLIPKYCGTCASFTTLAAVFSDFLKGYSKIIYTCTKPTYHFSLCKKTSHEYTGSSVA